MRPELSEKEKMRIWLEAWEKAAPVMEMERHMRIRHTDTKREILAFSGILPGYFRRNGFRNESGLVEMQRLFRKLGRDGVTQSS